MKTNRLQEEPACVSFITYFASSGNSPVPWKTCKEHRYVVEVPRNSSRDFAPARIVYFRRGHVHQTTSLTLSTLERIFNQQSRNLGGATDALAKQRRNAAQPAARSRTSYHWLETFPYAYAHRCPSSGSLVPLLGYRQLERGTPFVECATPSVSDYGLTGHAFFLENLEVGRSVGQRGGKLVRKRSFE